MILIQLKKRLGNAKGLWTDNLLKTLWAYKCKPQITTRETPFNLAYGMDAMILVEIGEPTLRQQLQDFRRADHSNHSQKCIYYARISRTKVQQHRQNQ